MKLSMSDVLSYRNLCVATGVRFIRDIAFDTPKFDCFEADRSDRCTLCMTQAFEDIEAGY